MLLRILSGIPHHKVNIPVRDKGKRKIVKNVEEEQSYKFKADPLVQKASLAIKVKRQQCN